MAEEPKKGCKKCTGQFFIGLVVGLLVCGVGFGIFVGVNSPDGDYTGFVFRGISKAPKAIAPVQIADPYKREVKEVADPNAPKEAKYNNEDILDEDILDDLDTFLQACMNECQTNGAVWFENYGDDTPTQIPAGDPDNMCSDYCATFQPEFGEGYCGSEYGGCMNNCEVLPAEQDENSEKSLCQESCGLSYCKGKPYDNW